MKSVKIHTSNALQRGTSKVPNFRSNSLEQYYTLPDLAESCFSFMVEKIGKDHQWIEPTAGTGVFVEVLKKHKIHNFLAFDIDPKHPEVLKQDFLKTSFDNFDNVFIGNPPFGRACSIAIKIFNHCARYGKYIGFIVPKSFNKISIQDRLNQNFHLIHKMDCPSISFTDENGAPYEGGLLRTEFQIWIGDAVNPRDRLNSYRSRHFAFVRKTDPHDFAFRTHGSGAGRILPEGDHNPRTTAFIRTISPDVKEAFQRADFTHFSQAVAYIPCLGSAEISLCIDNFMSNNKGH